MFNIRKFKDMIEPFIQATKEGDYNYDVFWLNEINDNFEKKYFDLVFEDVDGFINYMANEMLPEEFIEIFTRIEDIAWRLKDNNSYDKIANLERAMKIAAAKANASDGEKFNFSKDIEDIHILLTNEN